MPLVVEPEVPVVIADDQGLPPKELLKRVVARAGLWDLVADAARRAAVPAEALRIVIKPDLGGFQLGSPAATDPALVENLIDLLHDEGYSNVAVVGSSDSSSSWADNRDVMALADLLGYRYLTSAGRPYDVLDLAENLEAVSWPEGSCLHDSPVSQTWTGADFRIMVAKNRTDEAEGYALCADNLIGILPLADKDYYYRHRFDPGTVVADILSVAPPHFALIDAIVSAHGSGGSRAPRALATGTLIASPAVLLADYIAALKMGVDPHVSRLMARALQSAPLPVAYRIDGSLAMYKGWRAVHPLVTDATRRREDWVAVSRTLKPWLQRTDGESFPFRNPVDARANAMFASRVAHVDEDATALSMLLLVSYGLGWIYQSLNAYRVMYDKDRMRRREVALGIDHTAFELSKYEAAFPELEGLRELLRDTPTDASGLKWRYVGESVVFEIDRCFPVPFEEFTGVVCVSRTIQFMNDYIGGVAIPVALDERGRVTHQAERNLYLAQPNYMVLYQAEMIDVTKLEHVEYRDNMHRMCWKTIRSENGSAQHDDGIVTFAKEGDGTRVSIFGRQLFTLPPFLQVVNLNLNPELKERLVTQAYTTFFNRTFANFEALLEGRDIRIGSAWHDPSEPPGTEPLLSETLGRQLLDLVQKYGPVIERGLQGKPGVSPTLVDAGGFAHFRPAPSRSEPTERVAEQSRPSESAADGWAEFWCELADAVRRDIDWQARHGVELA